MAAWRDHGGHLQRSKRVRRAAGPTPCVGSLHFDGVSDRFGSRTDGTVDGASDRTGQLGDLRAAGNASRTSRFSRRPIRRSPNPRSTQRRSVPWAVSPASRPSRWASRSSMPKTQPVPRSPSPWSASSPVTSWRRAWLEDRSWTVPAAESSSPERSLLTACAWADAALEQASCYRAARCMPCAPGHALDLDRESAAYGPHASRPPA